MTISTVRFVFLFICTLLLGALIGAFSVFLTDPSVRLKPLKLSKGLAGGNAVEFFNNACGAKIGSFAVYHSRSNNEMLCIVASETSYPVIFIKKAGAGKVEVSISDKKQNILSGNLKNEEFDLTSYLNAGQEGLKVTNIDMNADGSYDLVSKQTKCSTETKFLFEGQWYPYKGENGKWMIQSADGWREIEKCPLGFRFR